MNRKYYSPKAQEGGSPGPELTACIGQASADQIKAWKAQYGNVLAIKVVNKDKSVSICYLKSADRNVASLATTHVANKRYLEAGGVFIANCWLGGDEQIKTIDRLYLAACQEAYDSLDIAESSSEKI